MSNTLLPAENTRIAYESISNPKIPKYTVFIFKTTIMKKH